MTALQVLAFFACVALASSIQSITGFAIALVLLGLTGLFHLAPLLDAANVATVLSLASAAIALRSGRRSIDFYALRATVAVSVFCVPLVVALLAWLHSIVVTALRVLLG